MAKRFTAVADGDLLKQINDLSQKQNGMSVEEVRLLIGAVSNYFKRFLESSGYDERKVRAIMTKFRDAGRRSAPWQPASKKVPGRPQDGADGNRQPRWNFPPEHKFYADEINATLVEVKYYLQTLSMEGVPSLPADTIQDSFIWLLGHAIAPGNYIDPIQLIPINFNEFINDPRLVQSGHLVPLDRGGRHVPSNTFLMLYRSNQIQGNQTLDELVELMKRVVKYHDNANKNDPPEV